MAIVSGRWWAVAAVTLAIAGCGGTGSPDVPGADASDVAPDLGVPDLGGPDLFDAGPEDAGLADEGLPDPGTPDEGTPDLGTPDDGVADPGPEDPGPTEVADTGDTGGEPDLGPQDACEGPLCTPCPPPRWECAVYVRDDAQSCTVAVLDGWCLIDGACFEAETVDPEDQCRICDPARDPQEWVVAAELACDDGKPCSTGGICTPEGACVPAAPICDDANPCTVDACKNGGCIHANAPTGSVCTDFDNCTTLDHCDGGQCVATPKNCGLSTDPCIQKGCDQVTGNCVQFQTSDPCNDDDPCTEDDVCHNGLCGGRPKDCNDFDPCTIDYCAAGVCNPSVQWNYGPCEDGDFCTVGETCNPSHVCGGGQPRTCNDNVLCTDDACDPAVGCVFTPNALACDDGDGCTVDDRCTDRVCKGAPKDCSDNNECTQDLCSAGFGCRNLMLSGSPCEDGDPCTSGDLCNNGVCGSGGPNLCEDGNACTGTECVPGVGCSFAAVPCDDGNPCTDDSCDPATGCVHGPRAGACDDGDACTLGDQCTGGACKGAPKNCSDGKPCTLDVCTAGVCSNPVNLGDCDDGNACTIGEKCIDGVCAGNTRSCNDDNPCTNDSCDPATGCVNAPRTGTCDDFSVCTTGDQCIGGQCVGSPKSCDDQNFCTDDLCDALNGCWYRNNDFLCDDGNACTFQDQCRSGACNGQSMFADPVARSATLQFGRDGLPGHGVDVDGSAGTCTPKNNCSGGIDNIFANLSVMSPVMDGMLNPTLATQVNQGRMSLVLEIEGLTSAAPFTVNVFHAQEVQQPSACNPAGPGCDWKAFASDLIGSCYPKGNIDNATFAGGHLSAGGKEYQATVYIPLTGTSGTRLFPLPLRWVRIEADVTTSGSTVTGGSGALGGVFNCQELADGLNAVPAGYFSPYTRAEVISAVSLWVTPYAEFDLDGDKKPESCSIGLPFTLVTGRVVGRL